MKKIYTFIAFLMFLAFAGTTFAAKPVVNLHSASNITTNSANLSLSYNTDTTISAVIFEYSTDPSFGSNTQMLYGSTTNATNTSVSLSNLSTNKRYYYRASVTNNDGSTLAPASGSFYFDTLNSTNTQIYSETLGGESINSSSMTLTGRVNTYNTSGTAYFKLYNSSCSSLISTTNSTSLNSTSGSQYLKHNVSGLSNNTSYCSELFATINGVTYSGGKVIVKTSNTISTPSTCNITNFTPDSTSIYSGSSTTLRWSTTNCTSLNLTTVGTVSNNSSVSTGALYSTTSYTLSAYGANNNDTRTITIGVLPTNTNCTTNCGGVSTTYPSCYYSSTCYWNGSYWVSNITNNNNPYNNYYPYSNYTTNVNTYTGSSYPSCYYNASCYWTGSTWAYNNTTNTITDNYTYKPHSSYTGGPTYVYNKLPPTVNTVYVDQEVPTQIINQPTNGKVSYYNNRYNSDIMQRLNNTNYDNVNYRNNNVLLTGSAGSAIGFNLIGLLIVLIIILIIVYVVKTRENK